MKLSLCSGLLLTALGCSFVSDAFRILVVFPMPSNSHAILGDGVVRNLAAAGHEITYITAIPSKNHPKNVRQIDVKDNFKLIPETTMNIKTLSEIKKISPNDIFSIMINIHNTTLHNQNVRKLLEDTSQHFDLIIVEWLFIELFSGLAGIFNAPYIWVSTVEPHWMMLRMVDEVPNPAYVADTFSSIIPPFSFRERVQQLWNQIVGYVYREFISIRDELEVYSTLAPYFKMRGRELPCYEELRYNASLIFGNSYVSLGQATRLPQNYKTIGGYHINTDVAPLPEDLQKILDTSKHGVIYFSMGSIVKSKNMPEELKQSLLKMFGGLKQTVLWKFEEALPGLPSNVHILNWAPQQSILAHPNCVLFISHGGLLSTTEAIHFAKPVIGIPVFGDQFINVNRAVAKGFAKRVELSFTMAGELEAAINEMILNPRYLEKVKELSFIYHDRPAPPGTELVHWARHVVSTGGAPHLRSPALAVRFHQKAYLDLLALLVGALLLIIAVIRRIFKTKPSKEKRQ